MRYGFLVVVFCATLTQAETMQQRIASRVHQYVDAGLFSGVVLVSKGNDKIFEQAFGLADRELNVPNSTTSKFQIASLSKPITAVAVLRLVEEGKLSLSDHLSKFVPDFPSGDKITIEVPTTPAWPIRHPDYSESRFANHSGPNARRFRRQRFGHRSVYVNGSSPGFKAHFERFIDDDAAVIVLSNLYLAAPSIIAET